MSRAKTTGSTGPPTDDVIKTWLVRLNGHEGGYANRDPSADPGGETKWGISKRSYPHIDIKNLTLAEAEHIYRRDFLAPLLDINLRHAVIFQLLGFAVHSGIRRATRTMQQELNLKDDGIIGPITLSAIQSRTESDLTQLLLAGRLDYLTHLRNWPQNSRGWSRRIAQQLRYGALDTD